MADAAGRAVACPTLPNKMKAKLIPILAAGLFLMPAQPLRASVDCLMSLVANCYYQQKFTSVGTVTTGHVDMVRVDSKQLLLLLEKELNMKLEHLPLKAGKIRRLKSHNLTVPELELVLHGADRTSFSAIR